MVRPQEHSWRGAPVQTDKNFPRNRLAIRSEEHARRSDKGFQRKHINSRTRFIVMVRSIKVRAGVNAAGELAHIARSTLAQASDEPEIVGRVARPRGQQARKWVSD